MQSFVDGKENKFLVGKGLYRLAKINIKNYYTRVFNSANLAANFKSTFVSDTDLRFFCKVKWKSNSS